MNDPRGSMWRLWDLHYHTPSSYDVADTITNEDIVDELLGRNIAAVAITDHHVMDVQRIKELQVIAGDRLTIFPGIEFRSELGGRSSVHFIGIFSPDSDLDHIRTTLQGKLSITSKDIIDKGGNDSIYVDFQEGCGIIHDLGGIVSVHAGKKSNSIERISHASEYQRAVKVDIVRKCIDIFEAKDKEDAEDYRNIIFPNIKMERPIIVASDTHHSANDAERVPCWIKADTTFAGLKRILVEPDRVFLGKEPQAMVHQRANSTRYCDLISFSKRSDSTLEDIWFSGEVPLNSGLVAIIGNKGSGKSALADTIGLTGNSRQEPYFSFLSDKKFRRARERKAEQFEASLFWLSGTKKVRKLSDNIDITGVETVKYIPQNYLEAICNEVSGGEGSGFDRELKSVIFSHVPDDQRLNCNSFDELMEFRTNETIEHIELLQGKLHDLNEQFVTLNEQLTEEHRQSLEQKLKHKKAELEAHIKNRPSEVKRPDKDPAVEDQNSKLTAEIEKVRQSLEKVETEIDKTTQKSKQALQRKALAEKLKAKLENLQRTYDEFATSCFECEKLGIELNDVVTFEVRFGEVNKIITASESENEELSSMLLEEKEGSFNNQKKDLLKKIAELRRTMDIPNQKYQQYLEDFAKWEAGKKEIEGGAEIPNTLLYIREQIEKLKKLPYDLEKIQFKRVEAVKAIYNEIESLANMYASLYSPIEKAVAGDPLREQGLQIGFKVAIVPENFEERLFQLIHQGRRGTFCGVEEGQKLLRKMLQEADFSTIDGVLTFVDNIDKSLSFDLRDEDKQPVRLSNLARKGVKTVEIYDYIFGLEYLFPRYALTWGARTLDQLSPGERGALLLVFYLLIDKKTIPLIIDQPEENLDNESVYRMLVPCIKKAKEKRQVIIVTHNPNLAVVCDADQVIYCDMDKPNGNRVTYITGAIENPTINNHIIDVLEGTRPAFDVRDAKYKLLKK